MASAVASGSQSRHATPRGSIAAGAYDGADDPAWTGPDDLCAHRAVASCGRCGWENMASHDLRLADPCPSCGHGRTGIGRGCRLPDHRSAGRIQPDRLGHLGPASSPAARPQRGRRPRSRASPGRRRRRPSRQPRPGRPSVPRAAALTGTGRAFRVPGVQGLDAGEREQRQPAVAARASAPSPCRWSCRAPAPARRTPPRRARATTGTSSRAALDGGQGLGVSRRVPTVRRQRQRHLRRRLAGVPAEHGVAKSTLDRLRRAGHTLLSPIADDAGLRGFITVCRRTCGSHGARSRGTLG